MNSQAVFSALAEPIRRQLLEKLASDSPKTATQLAGEYPITRQGVLKHLQVLESAGLVASSREGRDKLYRMTPEPLGEMERWIQSVGGSLEDRLHRLKAMLEDE